MNLQEAKRGPWMVDGGSERPVSACYPLFTTHYSRSSRPRFVLGLAGPSGSGKSTAAGILKGWGAWVVEGDLLGRLAIEDPQTRSRVMKAFKLKTLDRKALARRVFGDSKALARLSGLTWPFIGSQADTLLSSRRSGLLVLDAAVLLEAGWGKFCDRVLVLRASEALRFKRLTGMGLSPGEARLRIRSQAGLGQCPGADELWWNGGSVVELKEELRRLLLRWGGNTEPVPHG